MKNATCTFCRIVAGELPAHVIGENERVIVFLSLSNHPMVVPKAHIPDIYTLSPDVGAAVMAAASSVARAVKEGLACDGVYLTQANGYVAGQDVFHYHLHVYPCWGERSRRAVVNAARALTTGEQVTEAAKAARAQQVRQALGRL